MESYELSKLENLMCMEDPYLKIRSYNYIEDQLYLISFIIFYISVIRVSLKVISVHL